MPVVVVIAGVALDVIDVLVLLMVAYFATILLIKPLTWLLGQIPIIGEQIAKALNDGANAFMTWMQDNVKNSLAALVALVSAPVKWLSDVVSQTVAVAEAIVAQVVSVIQQVEATASNLSNWIASVKSTVANLLQLITNLQVSIAKVIDTVIPNAIAALRAIVANWIDSLRKAIAQAIDAAHVELGHAIDNVMSHIGSEVAKLYHAIDNAIKVVEAWVNDRLRPIEKEIGDIGKVVWALPAVATIVGTIEAVKTIEVTIEECVVPTCNGLGSSFDILEQLANGAMLAAVMAVTAEAINDPQAGARTMAGIAGELHGMVDAVLSPVGISL